MATIAIGSRIDDDESPPQTFDEEPPPPPTCWGRAIVRGSLFLSTFAGNGHPSSKFGFAWQKFTRIILFLLAPTVTALELMWPCWGDSDGDGVLDPPDMACDAPPFYTWILPIFGGALAIVMIGIRVHTPESVKLLRTHKRVTAGHTYTYIEVIRAFIALMGIMLMLSTINDGTRERALSDPKLKAKGTTTAVVVLSTIGGVGFPILAVAAFDAVFCAAQWLNLTTKVFRRFADDVCAVATQAAVKVDLEAGRVLPIAVALSDDDNDDSVTATAPPLMAPEAEKIIVAQARVKRSFEKAWEMSLAVNRIFAMPLSVIFLVFFGFTVMGAYFVVIKGEHNMIGFVAICGGTSMAILMWASTAGDAFTMARQCLLRPDVCMGLLKAIGPVEQATFTRALERTSLGLDIVNVTITTQKVHVFFFLSQNTFAFLCWLTFAPCIFRPQPVRRVLAPRPCRVHRT